MTSYPIGTSPITTEPITLSYDTIKVVSALQTVEKIIQQTTRINPVVHDYKTLLINVLSNAAYGDPITQYTNLDEKLVEISSNIAVLSVGYQSLGSNLISLPQ